MVYVLPSGANGGVGNNLTNNGSGSNTGPNWMNLCTKISFALSSSCDTLVNSDNTLTSQGMHVRDCIQGGALLAEVSSIGNASNYNRFGSTYCWTT